MAINCVSLFLMRSTTRQSLRSVQSLRSICQCSNNQGVIAFTSNRGFNSLPPNFQLNTAATHKLSSNPAPLSPPNEDTRKENEALLSRISEGLKLKKQMLEEPEETEPHVIYEGVLTGQMKRLKLFSLTTSGMGLAMQPVLIQKAAEIPLAGSVAAFGMVGFFTFGTPFLIHLIAKKYVTEVIYDPQRDEYQATTFTFFMRKKKTVFKIDDVKVPDVPGPFTTLTIKTEEGKYVPFFLAPEAFLKPSHYGRFMGYDKPIDLRLTPQNTDSNNSKSERRNE
ncbi:Transmembrane protein [Orchesella cincta]|uniref:Transmembrane protein n=1 Tax=Orchesella cincta TaxID=48709 RepID=A0A1D2MMC8_ORCCI|nr:Transmembrane protein [Orchesella cincta]